MDKLKNKQKTVNLAIANLSMLSAVDDASIGKYCYPDVLENPDTSSDSVAEELNKA